MVTRSQCNAKTEGADTANKTPPGHAQAPLSSDDAMKAPPGKPAQAKKRWRKAIAAAQTIAHYKAVKAATKDCVIVPLCCSVVIAYFAAAG